MMTIASKLLRLFSILLFLAFLQKCSNSSESQKRENVDTVKTTVVETMGEKDIPKKTAKPQHNIDSQFYIHAYDDIFFGTFGASNEESINSSKNLAIKGNYSINNITFYFRDPHTDDSLGLFQFKLVADAGSGYTEREFENDYIEDLQKIVTVKYGPPFQINEYIPPDKLNEFWQKVLGHEQAPPKDNGEGKIMYLWNATGKKINLGYTKSYTSVKVYTKNKSGDEIIDSTIKQTKHYSVFFQFTSTIAEELVNEKLKELDKQKKKTQSEKF